MRKVRFSGRAKRDLLGIGLYITDQSGGERARAYVRRIEDYCSGLAQYPERGTVRNDLGPGVRIVGFERRATIVFHITPRTVVIDRVLYAGRSLSLH